MGSMEAKAKVGLGPKLLLEAREAAALLSICERQLRKLAAQGKIKVVKMGRRCVRYPMSSLQEFVDGRSERIGERKGGNG